MGNDSLEHEYIDHKGELKLHKQNKFGTEYYYPANELSEKFSELLKKKTIPMDDLKLISAMGFLVTIKGDETITL